MVFRYEAPVAGVKGIMAVVAHHPIVVQLAGVGVCFLSVDVDTVRFLFQCIAFISYDATFVNGQVSLFRIMVAPFSGIQTGP